jgi:hydrogenase-4 component B
VAVTSLEILLAAAAGFGVSGVLRGRLGVAVTSLAALAGLIGVATWWGEPSSPAISLPWRVPMGGLALGLDALSVAFVLPVLTIPTVAGLYGVPYMSPRGSTGRRTRLAFGLLQASMVVVLLARDAFLLLVAWEVMALSSFLLIATEDDDAQVRASAWVYLVATHLGTICLLAGFAAVSAFTGGLILAPVSGLDSRTLAGVSLLFLVGFGTKAGMMPLHFWLPGAHANAPSHVSAVMSGVVIKMGVYGLMRMSMLLEDIPAEAGSALLTVGALSAVVAAALAVAQSDLKRLLAYSSVDNVAIVLMGLGRALVGRGTGRDDLVVLGVAAADWHVWNHALFKSLMFLVAGAVVHATGTRRLDELGGLARSMPETSVAAVIGALALAGLPPLNGFLSELVLYVGLARSGPTTVWPALAVPALAVTGALALAAMLKVYGGAFLGVARGTTQAHDPPGPMRFAIGATAAACAGVVVGAIVIVPMLDRVADGFAPGAGPGLATLLPVGRIAALSSGVGVFAAASAWWLARRAAVGSVGMVGTWDCGYAITTPRVQYTPGSLSESVAQLFRLVVAPSRTGPELDGAFPAPSAFTESIPDPVLDRVAVPALTRAAGSLTWLRLLQQGRVQAYVLYILVALLALLWLA